MIRNYILTALRTLLRNREYAIINLAGLAISIGACLVLFIVIRFELSFNNFSPNASSLYRLVMTFPYPEGDIYTPGVPAPTSEALRSDFPQLKVGTILSIPGAQINLHREEEEVHFREEVLFAEPEFFSMLALPWLQGSPASALSEPNSVALTRPIAEKYFGTWQNALGKTIRFQKYELKVNGILDEQPANSDFPMSVVISYITRKETDTDWGNVTSRRQCYIQLPEKVTAAQVESLLPAFNNKYLQGNELVGHFVLQPLSEIHFDERYGSLAGRTISRSTLLSLGVMGIFLLITASINFINLAIAQIMKRSKEVGVRKVLGSNRYQLTGQFFGETLVILVLASLMAVVIVEVTLPFLRPVLNLPAKVNPVGPLEIALFLAGLVAVLTLLAGIYPAGIMSRFRPIEALKSKVNSQAVGGVPMRKGLVVVQFVIAQILITVTLVILLQLKFFRDQPLGFNKDSILFFSLPSDSVSRAKIDPLRNVLAQQPGISSLSFHFTPPSWRGNRTSNFRFDQSSKDEPFEVNQKYADVDYFKLYGLHLIAGRIYEPSDTAREYVVNETFLRKLGVTDPQKALGKMIAISGVSKPIVGVISDFHNRSLHAEIEPLILSSNRAEFGMAAIKVEPQQLQETIQALGQAYASFFPASIFEYKFLDDALALSYRGEERLASMTNLFTCLSIFISCLGIYGLISFMAVQRTKEVGIRKVLGATVTDIVFLFSREFIVLVSVAFIISAPVAMYFMHDWLSRFAYHIGLSAWIFLLSIGSTLAIALLTVASQSIKAAMANPVKSLRNE